MIIQTSSNIIIPSVNSVYSQQLISGISYNNTSAVGILNGTIIYQAPNGQFIFVNGSNRVVLPTIFTSNVLGNLYSQLLTYYMLNEGFSGTATNAVYIDSSNNIYLGYYNSSCVIGMQFLSGSTSINKQGLFLSNVSKSTGSTGFVPVIGISFVAQLTNPTVTYTLYSDTSGTTATAYASLDGTASSQNSTGSTNTSTYTYQFSVTDTNINQHQIIIYAKIASSGANAYAGLKSLY